MDRLKYLMERYETNDIFVLNCRVPFDYNDEKLNELSDEEYIDFIDKIEEEEYKEISKIVKERMENDNGVRYSLDGLKKLLPKDK